MINFMHGRFLALVLTMPLLALSARANVSVTNLRFDGGVSPAISVAATNINITYILNEPAALGVTINISLGGKLVNTLTAAPGAQGTLFGSNLVVWNSTDSNGVPVTTGNYFVSITAAAGSHTNWTQISQDTSPGNYTHDPRGLAVNNNSNSLYYGRVFVGNAHEVTNNVPGEEDTILKLNADGSFAADGSNGNGGYDLVDLGDYGVPQKMRVGEDDRLYMMDLNNNPQLAAFDMLLSTNEVVLSLANYVENPFEINGSLPGGTGWFSMDVTDVNTTNGLIWLGQWDADGAGIWNWNLTNGATSQHPPAPR
jgi:hypothetical protein